MYLKRGLVRFRLTEVDYEDQPGVECWWQVAYIELVLECHLNCIACECYRPDRCHLWTDTRDSSDQEVGCLEVEERRKGERSDTHGRIDLWTADVSVVDADFKGVGHQPASPVIT